MSKEERDRRFQFNRRLLEKHAEEAKRKGLTPDTFVVFFVEVNDPAWFEVVELLLPEAMIKHYRQQTNDPVAHGIISTGFADHIKKLGEPEIAEKIEAQLPPNKARVIMLARGGASVYLVDFPADPPPVLTA